MQACPEDGISLQKHQLSEQVSCVSEDAVWCVAAGSAVISMRRGRGQAVWDVLYGSLQESAGLTVRTWLLALTARGIQNGPTLELIQTSFEDDNPSPPAELSQRISAPSPLPCECLSPVREPSVAKGKGAHVLQLFALRQDPHPALGHPVEVGPVGNHLQHTQVIQLYGGQREQLTNQRPVKWGRCPAAQKEALLVTRGG